MAATESNGLERLNSFVGTWKTNGIVKGDPSAPPAHFTALDTYEWLPGGHFLLHRFDADMPEGNVKGIEVIGFRKEDDSYPMRSYDSLGNESVMEGRFEAGVWRFVGQTVRFSGAFRDNGNVFAGAWEMRPDEASAWRPWMDVTLTNVDGANPE